MDTVEIRAHAKINLTLDVLGQRPDRFHEVKMVMQGILLHDTVRLTRKSLKNIQLSCNIAELEDPGENLAFRAASLMAEDFPQVRGLSIDLEKRIPLAAGLGGGSTDAAAVLLGLNELFALKLHPEALRGYAEKLGSDVTFCLQPLTALAEGRGEIITPLPGCPVLWLVLFKPPYGISAQEAYGNLQRVKIVQRPSWRKMSNALRRNDRDGIIAETGNVLEYSVYSLYPELYDFAKDIEKLGFKKVMMSGSGPTLIAFAPNEEEAALLAGRWAKQGWEVIPTRTLTPGDIG